MGNTITTDSKQMFLAFDVNETKNFSSHQGLYFHNFDILICTCREKRKTLFQKTIQYQDDSQYNEQTPDNSKIIRCIVCLYITGKRCGRMKELAEEEKQYATEVAILDGRHSISPLSQVLDPVGGTHHIGQPNAEFISDHHCFTFGYQLGINVKIKGLAGKFIEFYHIAFAHFQ